MFCEKRLRNEPKGISISFPGSPVDEERDNGDPGNEVEVICAKEANKPLYKIGSDVPSL